MFWNYLKIALRNLRSRSGFAAINMLGFGIGMACCMLIALFVQYEFAFDRFHTKGEQIYRLNKKVNQPAGAVEDHAITAGLMGPAIVDLYPEVEESVRLLPWFDDVLFAIDDEAFKVADVVFADDNFFSVFDFSLLQGNEKEALAAPLTVVLSESTASLIFGDEDPIGRVITGLNDLPYTVTGIIEDAPEQSHLQYNALISWSSTLPGEGTLNFSWLNRWLTQANYTYLLLRPGADPATLIAKFPALLEENLPSKAAEYQLYLQPLHDIYLNSSEVLHSRNLSLGNKSYVTISIIVGLLILLIACFNFINLTTAQSGRRSREIGVRKVLGARREQIARQFFNESLLLILLSFAFAVCLVVFLLPAFNSFINRTLTLNLFSELPLLFSIILLILLTGLFAASYPALILSRFRPVKVLKRQVGGANAGLSFRRVLIVSQFLASIILIVGTIVVQKQLRFIQETDPGFEREQIIVLPTAGTAVAEQFLPFKEELLRHPNITHAAGSNSVPGSRDQMMSFALSAEGQSGDENLTTYVWRLDDSNLIDTYNMKMAAGRFFSDEFPSDATQSIVINEALVDMLGWENPVGKSLEIPGEVEGSTVIGVIQDFHFESFHHAIEPLAFYIAPRYGNMSLRVQGGNLADVMSFISETWQRFDPVYPVQYYFLDEATASYYETEERLMDTLTLFSLLAVLIACLGLFGLAAISVQKRTKEIGVRKAIGADVPGLVYLLTKDFVKLVGLAFLLSIPIAFLSVNTWLSSFTYRVDLSIWVFLLAGLIAMLIAFLTVSTHCLKAALSNPVIALRYE